MLGQLENRVVLLSLVPEDAMKLAGSGRTILFAGGLGVAFLFLYSQYFDRPRVLAVNEVPVSFWAWRNAAPTSVEVQNAFAATNAKTLFLRTGQFDIAEGAVHRIRPVSGALPQSAELHLVYNATRRFLRKWEQTEI